MLTGNETASNHIVDRISEFLLPKIRRLSKKGGITERVLGTAAPSPAFFDGWCPRSPLPPSDLLNLAGALLLEDHSHPVDIPASATDIRRAQGESLAPSWQSRTTDIVRGGAVLSASDAGFGGRTANFSYSGPIVDIGAASAAAARAALEAGDESVFELEL